jgi:hypothetical protein
MLIKVKVFPNSKKQEIIKRKLDEFLVYLQSKPEKGQANKELISLLSVYFNTPPERVRIIKGQKQRNKIIEIIKV